MEHAANTSDQDVAPTMSHAKCAGPFRWDVVLLLSHVGWPFSGEVQLRFENDAPPEWVLQRVLQNAPRGIQS